MLTLSLILWFPSGSSPLGMRIVDDPEWNIPKLEKCILDTSAFKQLAPSHRRNMHNVSVDGIEPITAEYAISLLAGSRRLRSELHRTISIQLSPRKSRTRSNYEQHRASFDTLRPIIAYHQAVLPVPPPSVTLIHKAYSGTFRKNYIAATIKQYMKILLLYLFMGNQSDDLRYPVRQSSYLPLWLLPSKEVMISLIFTSSKFVTPFMVAR
jgi:hypothetical protein